MKITKVLLRSNLYSSCNAMKLSAILPCYYAGWEDSDNSFLIKLGDNHGS